MSAPVTSGSVTSGSVTSGWGDIRFIGLTLVLMCVPLTSLELVAIELRDADRVSIHPTEPTDVTLIGNGLRSDSGEISAIWASFPASVEPLDIENKDKNSVRYRITPTAPSSGMAPASGIVAVRAFTANSISRPLLFTVETLPIEVLPPPPETVIRIPMILEGRSPGLAEHKIAIHCEKGKPFVAEVVGARVGCDIDAVLVLHDATGRELTFSDDHPSTGSDPILTFTPEITGTHYLIVRDVEYRGGLRLQVRLTQTPSAAICFPGAVRIGETRNIHCQHVDSTESQASFAIGGTTLGNSFIGAAGTIAPILVTDLPIHVESQRESKGPVDDNSDEQDPLPTPIMICGKLGIDGEVDSFQFAARKGDRLTLDSESLGPYVGHLRIFNSRAQGASQIVEHHWGRDPNGTLNWVAPEQGIYNLQIRDALGRGGDAFTYCVSIRNDLAPVVLKVALSESRKKDGKKSPHRFAEQAGKSLTIAVRVERRGYDGPISLHAQLDGQVCHVDGQVAEKTNDAQISIVVPAHAGQPTIKQLQLFGSCEIDGRTFRAKLDITEHVKADFPVLRCIPRCVVSGMPVVVTMSPASAPPATSPPATNIEVKQ